MIDRPHLVLVGGFLGAGKTTLILSAARELARRGLRSAAILNDQGDALVDTRMARAHGLPAAEVTGGCFCCRFSDLMERANLLRTHAPDVIFAEPVGSCADLNATVLLPIQTAHRHEYRLAPLTVLVDPSRALALARADADPDMAFLFSKQLQEADLVCMTKADLCRDLPEIRDAQVRHLSARTGEGVGAWLDEVLGGIVPAAGRILDIDYERYAQAEAALVWLNLEASFECRIPLTPAMALGPLFEGIARALTRASISIVHLKASDATDSGWVKAAVCANADEPAVEGDLDASPARHHELRVNLRATGDPEVVQQIVSREAARLDGRMAGLRLNCFRPSAPKPVHRMAGSGPRRGGPFSTLSQSAISGKLGTGDPFVR